MTKQKQKPITLLRKPKITPSSLSPAERYQLLEEYMSGEYTIGQLRDRYNLNDSEALIKFINGTITRLNIVKETSAINPATQSHYLNYKPTSLVNEPFLELLSPPAASITDEEMTYCYLYVFTGDNRSAIEQSGLDAGLNHKRIIKDTPTYDYALRVRGLLLRNKPNVKAHIDLLRSEKLKDNKIVDKSFVIGELVEQLNQLKEDGRERKLILETIKLLGQTCHAFTERIEVCQIDPNKPIDSLIEMAMKEANGTLLPAGVVTDCTYEVYEDEIEKEKETLDG